jgi:hypothetical protein
MPRVSKTFPTFRKWLSKAYASVAICSAAHLFEIKLQSVFVQTVVPPADMAGLQPQKVNAKPLWLHRLIATSPMFARSSFARETVTRDGAAR